MKNKFFTLSLMLAVAASAMVGCGSTNTSTNAGSNKTAEEAKTTDVAESPETSDVAAESTTEPVKITFWHSMGGVNGEAIDYLVNKFNSENTLGITVDSQYQGSYDDAINKLRSAQIGNMGADLVQIYDIGTRFMIDSGWVIPMQEMIEADGWDETQIEPNIAAYYSVDEKLYSMPFNSSTPILYYNKDIFEQAGITEIPTSFSEIEKVGDALLNKGGAGEVISLGIYGWLFEEFTCKQQLEYANNGNGRKDVASAVAFDENGAAKNILSAWLGLYD